MKVSEITLTDLKNYIKLSETDADDEKFLNNILIVAKEFIKNFTGLSDEEVDTHEDFYIVVMVLCEDMWDNRILYVDKNNLNKVVETILGFHDGNLL